MAKRDFYEVLGVPKTATDQEIKAAYRKMALEWHPDRNKTPEATQRFKEINEAYEVVGNKDKRASYDQFGHAAFEQGGFSSSGRPASGWGGGSQTYRQGPFTYSYSTGGQGFGNGDFGGFTDPFEIFEQFFGGGFSTGRRQQQRQVYQIDINFMDAMKGVEKEVEVGGKRKKIKIPAGVDNGNRIRFDDFDLVMNVRPHETFTRENNDIVVEKSISYPQAVLGTVTTVPTIDGPLDLRIQPGTQSGTLIRLRGKGVPHVQRGGRGDEYVKITVRIPTKLDKRSRELIQQLEREGSV